MSGAATRRAMASGLVCSLLAGALIGAFAAASIAAVILDAGNRGINPPRRALRAINDPVEDVEKTPPTAGYMLTGVHGDPRQFAEGNLFVANAFYVNPSYAAAFDRSAATAGGSVKKVLQAMRNIPSSYWINEKSKIRGNGTRTMEGILEDASRKDPPQLVTFVLYNLPNRDCNLKVSHGEICCAYLSDGSCDHSAADTCEEGIEEYKGQFIDPIVELLKEYEDRLPIALVVEPNSLVNFALNMDNAQCSSAATTSAYRRGVQYAVTSIGTSAKNVAMYVDAAHGGSLGWIQSMKTFANEVKNLDIAPYLRGFATNVGNYQSIGAACPTWDWCLNASHTQDWCCHDPCNLVPDGNPSQTEANFVQHVRHAMVEAIPGFTPHMIVDTSRNGIDNVRNDCKNWCNVRGAGAGAPPTVETQNRDFVDAYFWIKSPGESDGCTETLPDGSKCERFDSSCESPDSIGAFHVIDPRAPVAGAWFDAQIKTLAENADGQIKQLSKPHTTVA